MSMPERVQLVFCQTTDDNNNGPTSELKLFAFNKSVADDGTITCPAITTNAHCWIMVGTDVATRADFVVDSTGTVTIISSAGSVIANSDTDTDLCLGTAATQEPLQIKNRLGGTKVINLIMYYD